MPDFTIRRLTTTDHREFRTIRLEALRQAPDAFGSDYESEAAQPDDHFQMRLTNSTVLAAYVGSRIAGIAGFARHSSLRELHKAYLWGVYVRAEARGQGMGAALVGAILDQAAEGVEQILLTVGSANKAALTLYERLGFTAYGVEPRALKGSDGYLDEALMVKFLR
ncbi:MAG TPA: GNAT family N-acetyltransferase [Aliidongia sp.]|nr:GNAT family N-acetyltransferase [Aliidongia sp.]